MHARSTFHGARRRVPGLAALRAGAASVGLLVSACGGGGGGGGGAPGPAADTTPPTVLSVAPPGNASAVATSSAVTVTFSEAMEAASLTSATFTLTAAGVAVAGSVSASASAATFVPTAPLPGGTVYTAAVSVAARDAAGNPLAAAHTWSFTTVASQPARAWSVPVLLETSNGQAGSPAIAATLEDVPSAAAQATAVWIQHDGTQMSVYANRFREGAWQGAELVEDATAVSRVSAGGAGSPKVAMGAFGRAVMTWIFDDGNAGYSVWGNVYDPIPPSAAAPLPFASANARQLSFGGNAGDHPQVAFDGSGFDAFTVWTQYDEGRPPAAYRITQRPYLFVPCEVIPGCVWREGDFGWRSTSLVETNSYGAISPQVSGYGIGNAVAVWPQSDGRFGVMPLWANTHTKAGGWASPVQVNPGANTMASSAVVAAAANGSAIALWVESVVGRNTIFASRLSGSVWSTPIMFADSAAGQADKPQVVLDARGAATIVWSQLVASGWHLHARHCPPAALAACGATQKIESLAGNAEEPRLAGAPNGDAIVVWHQAEAGGGPRSIYAHHYSAVGASWGAAPALIHANADRPQIAMDKRGRATVVWSKQDDAARISIYASRFE